MNITKSTLTFDQSCFLPSAYRLGIASVAVALVIALAGCDQKTSSAGAPPQAATTTTTTTAAATPSISPPATAPVANAPASAALNAPVNAGDAEPPRGPEVLERYRHVSGVIVDELKLGEGMPCLPRATVRIHMTATLKGQATPYENTREPRAASEGDPGWDGQPLEANLAELLPGLRNGLVGMKQGGRRTLHIPASEGFAGFGRRDVAGNVVIPPGADLVYDVELIELRQRLVGPGSTAPAAAPNAPIAPTPSATPAPTPGTKP